VPFKRDGSWVKTQRINQITQKIAPDINNGKKVNLKKLFAWISITIGLTNKTATTYLEELATVYDWIIDDKFIYKPNGVK